MYGWEELNRDMRKALSLSPEEVVRRFSGRALRYVRRVRNRNKARALSEADLLAALSKPVASLEALGERRRQQVPLLPASLKCGEIGKALRVEARDEVEALLSEAGRLSRGVFDLLGSGPVKLGTVPDWHHDFKAGKRWDPGAYSLEIRQTPDRGHDIKVPWELSRLQHLPTLGLASALTEDPAFRDLALAQIRSFFEANPVYRGVNWNCTMDVALRASELLVAEGTLRAGEEDRFWGEWMRALYVHARFIRDNLEDGPVRGNHYISDLAGLYLCSLGLSEFKEAPEWGRIAKVELLAEMERQVGVDGFDYEASTSYHAFVTEMFLFPVLLGSEQGESFPDEYLERLERMVEVVATLIRPDGTLPQIGDNDDGRFLIFSQYHRPRRDWRPLLALGAYFFGRSEWLRLATDAWSEGAWVLGEKFLRWRRQSDSGSDPSGFVSRGFPQAGIYQLGGGPVQMAVDVGPVGQGGNGGHAHNDTLAFDLFGFGEEILPDRGTGAYTPSLRMRDEFRSTRSHNTVWVPGQQMNPFPEEPFRLISADSPRVRRWRVGTRFTYLSAEHGGYRRLDPPVEQARQFLFDKKLKIYLLQDHFCGEGRTRLEANFHLGPEWRVFLEEGGWQARNPDGKVGLEFKWILKPEALRCGVVRTLHSPSYGVALEAETVRVEFETELPCRLRYSLRPFGEETA